MDSSMVGILIAIIAYLTMVVAIGVVFSKKNDTAGDFYLGGRRLGPFVTAMSAEASDMSSWLLLGLPGVAYLSGIADAAWTAIGLAIGTYINWLVVAKRLRCYSHISDAITLPDYFSNRFHDKRKILMFIAALVIIIFFVPYTASGFSACGKLFNSLFGIDYFTAVAISAAIIVLYTTLGGFLAASTTDFIQSIIMSIALIVVLLFGIVSAGGLDAVAANANALPGYLSLSHSYDATSSMASAYGPITIVSTMAWGLGYFGMPHILLRFMAIQDEKKLKLSRRVATIWVVISLTVAVAIGIIGYAMSAEGVLPVLADPETVIIRIAHLISTYGFFFALVAGIILAGILASTMSTSDSQLLAASSSVSENILKGTFHLNVTNKMTMIIARVTVICIAIVAMIIARDPDSSVFNIVSFAWAGFGAAFGPVMLFSLFWKRINIYGAFAGMLAGGGMVFIWKYAVRPLGGIVDIYELLPSFIVACLAIVIVSLLTPKPSKEIEKEYEEYQKMARE
jgi:sodium/proline symporter